MIDGAVKALRDVRLSANTSTSNNVMIDKPHYDRTFRAAAKLEPWTPEEEQARNSSPEWLREEAEAQLEIAFTQSPGERGEALQACAKIVTLLPTPKMRRILGELLELKLEHAVDRQTFRNALGVSGTGSVSESAIQLDSTVVGLTNHQGKTPATVRKVGAQNTVDLPPIKKWLQPPLVIGSVATAIALFVAFIWISRQHDPQSLSQIAVYPLAESDVLGPDEREVSRLTPGKKYRAVLQDAPNLDSIAVFQISESEIVPLTFDADGKCVIVSQDIHGYIYFVAILADRTQPSATWFGKPHNQHELIDDLQRLKPSDDELCEKAMSRVKQSLLQHSHRTKVIAIKRLLTSRY
jgi:hypothetical protein